MTVAELIEALKDKDADTKVSICREDIIYPVTGVWCEDGRKIKEWK